MRTLLVLFLTTLTASAHGLLISTTVTPSTVRVRVVFDDDTPAAGSRVRILNAAGTTLVEGITDERGEAELPRPAEMVNARLFADAGDGHARTVKLPNAPADQVVQTEDEPNQLAMTLAGLAVIGGVVLISKWFWPRPANSQKSSPL